MNGAHLHLVVNHLPVVIILVALALLAFTAVRPSEDLTDASLGLLVAAAVIAGGAYLTGEPAEGVVENLPGISKSAIEEHEEAAEAAAVATGLAGFLAAGVLVAGRRRLPLPGWMMMATIVTAVAAAALMARAANLGGYIRHPEIARVLSGDQPPPTLRGVRVRGTKPREVVVFQG